MSESRLIRLHVIAKQSEQTGKLTHVGNGEWKSGHWRMTPETAKKAIGAELHLHENQDKPSWFAGIITDCNPSEQSDRVVFSLKKNPSLKRSHRQGWGNEQSRVWSTGSQDSGSADAK